MTLAKTEARPTANGTKIKGVGMRSFFWKFERKNPGSGFPSMVGRFMI